MSNPHFAYGRTHRITQSLADFIEGAKQRGDELPVPNLDEAAQIADALVAALLNETADDIEESVGFLAAQATVDRNTSVAVIMCLATALASEEEQMIFLRGLRAQVMGNHPELVNSIREAVGDIIAEAQAE